MNDRLILITGATSGIGKETAKALSELGFRIVITSREMNRGRVVKSEIEKITKNEVGLLHCDLSSQASVEACVEEFKSKYGKLDVLINNAGVWNTELKESPDGIEETFAVNVIAPYLMIINLLDLLKESSDPRILTVSSGLHFGEINFSDIEFRKKFSGFHAYRQSKLAVILLTRLLSKSLSNYGISINCMHPGLVNTKLGRHGNWLFDSMFRLFGKSAKKGADTLLYIVTDQEVKKISGEYFVNRKVKRTTAYSYDMNAAERLLKIVEEKSNVRFSGLLD